MSEEIKLVPIEGAVAEPVMIFTKYDKDIIILWKFTDPVGINFWGVANLYTEKVFDCFSVVQALEIFSICCEKYREEVEGGVLPS